MVTGALVSALKSNPHHKLELGGVACAQGVDIKVHIKAAHDHRADWRQGQDFRGLSD